MALRLYANSLSPFVRKVRITLYEKALAFDAVEIERGEPSLVYLGQPVPDGCVRLRSWLDRMRRRSSVERDAREALAAWERTGTSADPFFRADRIHWRGERVEWALRLGLGTWLAGEIAAGRAYFSPPPGEP